MKSFLFVTLEKYLKREGLSAFLPVPKDTTPFSTTFILLVCFSVGLITKLFGKSFWVGFFIPIILMAICLFVIITYIVFREFPKIIRSKGEYDAKSVAAYMDSKTLGTIIIVLFTIVTPAIVGIYLFAWMPVLIVFGVLLVILAFSIRFLLNRDYLILAIIEITIQAFKGWALSWQAVLATMPVLLVAILLSLFSGDLWSLLGKTTTPELTILITFMYIPVSFAVLVKIDLTDLISHQFLGNNEIVVDRVFSIPLIRKLKDKDLLSIEDRDDVIAALNWRDLDRSKELVADRLERRIRWWYLLVIILACVLLGLSFFIIFLMLFSLISSSLNQMGWLLPTTYPNTIQKPIPQVAYFLSSIQVAAFAASLLDKPKENILFKRTLEKATDWIAAIIVFQAIYLPFFQIWESKKEAPWHKRFGVTALRAKVIAIANVTDGDVVEDACGKLEELFPRVQLVDFSIYRKNEELKQKMRFGVEDFQWKYIHNRKLGKKQFTPIPYDLEIHEQHMLGREKLLAREEIPEEWFGSSKISAKIGKAIWSFDENHEVIMHPHVTSDDGKTVHVFINLFRKFRKSEEYSSLAHNLLNLVRELAPHATLISIVFYFRSGLNSKFIADLQWTNDGLIFYKDELKKNGNILTPMFSLFYRISKRN